MPETSETIFGKICVERGRATREQIAELMRRRSAGEPVPLQNILVSEGILTPREAESLAGEIALLLESGPFEAVRREDATLGTALVRKGLAAKEHVLEALSIQEHFARKGVAVPRLGQILVEKGHVPFAVLEETLRLRDRAARARCESCGEEYSPFPVHDAGGRRLRRDCAVGPPPRGSGAIEPAAPTPMPSPSPAPRHSPVDEEVLRASSDPRNMLGKYVLVRELGRGGMGAVYKAWDTHLRRWVAVKVLTLSGLGGGEELARFLREARTVAALQHPNIVSVYDVAQEGDRHFIVMKYVEGKSLAGQMLPVRRACEIMIDVARAVEHAHANKVIHRDLKPQNVMIDSGGSPCVMDFGLAKNLAGLNLTTPGTVVGTPSYMPPEQAAGHVAQIDPRSDVYSMGAILYELLTGQPPFRGSTPLETVKMVVNRPVTPPSKINPEVPRDLEAVILKALEKNKDRRQMTAGAFAKDIERYLSGRKVTLRRPSTLRNLRRRARRNPMLFVLLAAALAALAGLLALLL